MKSRRAGDEAWTGNPGRHSEKESVVKFLSFFSSSFSSKPALFPDGHRHYSTLV